MVRMEYDHIWDVVVPILLTVLLLVLVFTIAVCKYKKCMNMGKDVALRRHRKLWMTCGSLNNSEFPSRSTTEQSLYYYTTGYDQPTFVTDACVQTTDDDLITNTCNPGSTQASVLTETSIKSQKNNILSPKRTSNKKACSNEPEAWISAESVLEQQETHSAADNESNVIYTLPSKDNSKTLPCFNASRNPVGLSCDNILPQCYPVISIKPGAGNKTHTKKTSLATKTDKSNVFTSGLVCDMNDEVNLKLNEDKNNIHLFNTSKRLTTNSCSLREDNMFHIADYEYRDKLGISDNFQESLYFSGVGKVEVVDKEGNKLLSDLDDAIREDLYMTHKSTEHLLASDTF